MVSPSKVSFVIYLPVLAAYIIPALFLLPVGVTFSLLAIFDPTVTITQALSYDLWIIVPIAAAAFVFFAGRGLVSLSQRGFSPRVIVITIWGLFTITLFSALWIGVIILTSIGASENSATHFSAYNRIWGSWLDSGRAGIRDPLAYFHLSKISTDENGGR